MMGCLVHSTKQSTPLAPLDNLTHPQDGDDGVQQGAAAGQRGHVTHNAEVDVGICQLSPCDQQPAVVPGEGCQVQLGLLCGHGPLDCSCVHRLCPRQPVKWRQGGKAQPDMPEMQLAAWGVV